MLNILWASFFILAFFSGIGQSIQGNYDIWSELVGSLFSSSKNAFMISINLTGILCLWMGLLKIAEQSGLTGMLCKFLRPLFKKIFPEVPENSPAYGSMIMNMAANFLGLDNAATPMGLKAMEELQTINPHKDTASNAEILFMVINSSAVTLVPISIIMYRAEMGATNPSAVFLPILFATSASTLIGFLSVAYVQKLNIFNKVVLGYLLAFMSIIALSAYFFISNSPDNRTYYSTIISNMLLYGIVVGFIVSGLVKRLNVYEVFIEGAKEGFGVAVKIIPYLVAMLVGIAVFRSSGALDYIIDILSEILSFLGVNTDFVPALPTALLKPLSGSGARAMMIETMSNYGADSFPSFVSGVIQGSTETTFYILAVYFGAIKVMKTRHALPCALLADFSGISTAIICGYLFY